MYHSCPFKQRRQGVIHNDSTVYFGVIDWVVIVVGWVVVVAASVGSNQHFIKKIFWMNMRMKICAQSKNIRGCQLVSESTCNNRV